MKKLTIALLLILMLAVGLAGLYYFASRAAKNVLTGYCRKNGLHFQAGQYRLRLPGGLSLASVQLDKTGKFSFSAEKLELKIGLRDTFVGNWNLKSLKISNGRLELPENSSAGVLQFSGIEMNIQQFRAGSSGTVNMQCRIETLDFKKHGLCKGGQLLLNGDFTLSQQWLISRLQGSVQAAGVELSQQGDPLGSLAGNAVFALKQEASDTWQLIPAAGEKTPLNAGHLTMSGREALNFVCKSGEWKATQGKQTAKLQILASLADSEPLLALLSPEAYAWGSGQLKFLELDLRSQATDAQKLLQNLEGTAVFDIEALHLKNSAFIRIFSRRTTLDLSTYLLFDRGSAILRIGNQAVQITTTTPFQGRHPVIEAHGTIAFDGRLRLSLNLGFSLELEQLLGKKKYFQPFALLCQRNNGYLMLPGSLTLTGSLDSPGVDLTDLLKESAKAGWKNLFEDNGRIGIRIQRPGKK